MYIGSTGSRGLHHLAYEVVANSVDEALAGRCDYLEVTIHPDESMTVTDNGSGIPVDMMKDQGLPALTVVLTKLHAGGKFGQGGYKVSGGLHGVGISVVNALSEWLIATVQRDGKTYVQEFARGEPTTKMKAVGPTKETGTTISFKPDAEVFEETEWDTEWLVQRLRETAFLTKGLRIVLVDEREGEHREEFFAAGGIRDFVSHINKAKEPTHKHIAYFEGESDQGYVEVAMQWNNSYADSVFSFANNINTHEGGSHLSGFRSALTATLNKVARDKRPAQGEGRQPRGRGRPRGARRGHLREARRAAVRGADEDEARQPRDGGPRQDGRRPEARAVLRGEPAGREADHPEGDRRLARPPGRAQGARAHAAQVGARGRLAARQARRLRDRRPRGRPSSSSSRATPPAAPPSTRATASSRRSCRCAAR